MRRHIHKGRVIDVGTEEVTLPSGVTTTLDVILHPGASLVVPVVDGELVMIRQYRHCAHGWLWEFPAGTLNAGETPEECAHREVIEEAGLRAVTLVRAGHIFTAPGFTDEKIHIFVATECAPAAAHHDVDEVITEVRRFTVAACLDMLARGELTDAKSIAGLAHARRLLGT